MAKSHIWKRRYDVAKRWIGRCNYTKCNLSPREAVVCCGQRFRKDLDIVDLVYSGLNVDSAKKGAELSSTNTSHGGDVSPHHVDPPYLAPKAPTRVRTRPVDGGKAAVKTKEVNVECAITTVAADDVENEVSEEQLLETLDDMGMCPESYSWIRGRYPNDLCNSCKCSCYDGFRCAGGTHFVCADCITKRCEEANEQ